MNEQDTQQKGKRADRRVALACLLFAATMLGSAYASVPLYQLFCKVTGYGGTTQVAAQAPHEINARQVTVRFDANVAPELAWEFMPEQRERTVNLGETALVMFRVRNLSNQDTWGTASYNVTPERTGSYFAKLQCFCFDKQHLGPGETMEMPVVFFVDSAMNSDDELDKVKTITLSYTFFAAKPGTPKQVSSQLPKEAESSIQIR